MPYFVRILSSGRTLPSLPLVCSGPTCARGLRVLGAYAYPTHVPYSRAVYSHLCAALFVKYLNIFQITFSTRCPSHGACKQPAMSPAAHLNSLSSALNLKHRVKAFIQARRLFKRIQMLPVAAARCDYTINE